MTVKRACKRLGMTRQNYYARRKLRQRRAVDAGLVISLVRQERRLQPRLGARKLRVLLAQPLAEAGVRLGRDRFLEVLREHDLLLARRRSERPQTTNSYHNLPVFRNLVKGRQASRSNEIWVGDLTYLRTGEGFMFLSLLTDQASRHVVGYHCGDSLESMGCQQALKMALKQLAPGQKPIHHTDRGSQYCCHEYVKLACEDHGLQLSMTEMDHCAENALAERMNGIFKSEYGLDQVFKTKAQVLEAVPQAIFLYGNRRPHSSLGNRFPAQVYREEFPPCTPPAECPATGTQALRHELRTVVQSPAHVGATPVADHSVEPFGK